MLEKEKQYRLLFDQMVAGAALLEVTERDKQGRTVDVRILEVNCAYERLVGISREQLEGQSLLRLWPRTENYWFELADEALREGRSAQVQGYHQDTGMYLLVGVFKLGATRLGMTLIDISAQKQTEIGLEKARHDLENRVRQRTIEIEQVNRSLFKEIEARISAEKALLEKSKELETRTIRLEEANTALKVLLRARDSERRELEESVAGNINEMIRPHLMKLSAGNLSERRQALIDAITRGLDDITSPLGKRFIIESSRLTPVEAQVAGLIRQGRTSKEISEVIGVACSTVDFHRLNIRRKLNLTNKRTNLQSYLRSLQ